MVCPYEKADDFIGDGGFDDISGGLQDSNSDGFAEYGSVGDDFRNTGIAGEKYGSAGAVRPQKRFQKSTRKGKPKLKILIAIAGTLCLLVLIVLLIVSGVIPLNRQTVSNSSSDSPANRTDWAIDESGNGNDSYVEEVKPKIVNNTHRYDMSSVSVSITDIQPPGIVDNSIGATKISRVLSEGEAGSSSAGLMIDDDQKTFWASETDNKNPVITIEFAIEKEIGIIEMSLGAWASESDFQEYGVPTLMEMEIDGYVYPLSFPIKMTEQYILLSDNVKASKISFRIRETSGEGCAISEIRTFS